MRPSSAGCDKLTIAAKTPVRAPDHTSRHHARHAALRRHSLNAGSWDRVPLVQVPNLGQKHDWAENRFATKGSSNPCPKHE